MLPAATKTNVWANIGLLVLVAVILISSGILFVAWQKRQNPNGSPFWIHRYYHGSAAERQQAVGVLATRRPYDENVKRVLVDALQNRENGNNIRISAALALHESGLAHGTMLTMATNDPNPEVRAAISSILAKQRSPAMLESK